MRVCACTLKHYKHGLFSASLCMIYHHHHNNHIVYGDALSVHIFRPSAGWCISQTSLFTGQLQSDLVSITHRKRSHWKALHLRLIWRESEMRTGRLGLVGTIQIFCWISVVEQRLKKLKMAVVWREKANQMKNIR